MNNEIDLGFQPKSYFRPVVLERHLLSKIKGAVIRKKLLRLFDEGRHAEVRELLDVIPESSADRKVLEFYHPMFMGGNYLPETELNEVEIARISIQSTTYDVTSVYARMDGGTIRYRVVDEYEGETLGFPTEASSQEPMQLGDFADFFLKGWPLMEVLNMNFEENLTGALGFFTASSDFYPELDALCRERTREYYAQFVIEEEEEDQEEIIEI
jgi:hypothetical protein